MLPEQGREVFDVDNDIPSCAEGSNPFGHSYEKVLCVWLWGTEAVPYGREASRPAGCKTPGRWLVNPARARASL